MIQPLDPFVQKGNEGVTVVSYDIRLGQAALRAWIYPRMSDYMKRVVSAAGWDILAGALIWIQKAPFEKDGHAVTGKKVRSANLWFGKLPEHHDFRLWEVSYTTDKPEQPGFGLEHWWEPRDPKLAAPPCIINGEYAETVADIDP